MGFFIKQLPLVLLKTQYGRMSCRCHKKYLTYVHVIKCIIVV